jgi:hypothetical protein
MTMTIQRIEIHDVDKSGVLALDLRDVLSLIEPHPELRWYLLELEAVGQLREGESIVQLEERIADAPHGLELEWGELTSLAGQITQTINATLAGIRPDALRPTLPLKPYDGLEIVVEAIDTTLWAISTNDSVVIQRLLATYEKTKLLTWNG